MEPSHTASGNMKCCRHGLQYTSGVECLPSLHEMLCLIFTTAEEGEKKSITALKCSFAVLQKVKHLTRDPAFLAINSEELTFFCTNTQM